MITAIWISVGAAAGALSRYGIQWLLSQWWPRLPVGTFAANAIGCLGVGIASAFLPQMSLHIKLALVTGFFGSLTTLSSLQYEVLYQLSQGRLGIATIHWLGGSLGGLVLCGMGTIIGERLARFLV